MFTSRGVEKKNGSQEFGSEVGTFIAYREEKEDGCMMERNRVHWQKWFAVYKSIS